MGEKPEEYMQCLARFDFKNRSSADQAADKYKDKTSWTLTKPSLQTGAKSVWNGAPNKSVVLLEPPSQFHPLLAGSASDKKLSTYISPPMRLSEVLQMTSATSLNVDITLKITDVEDTRNETVRGEQVKVRNVFVADDSDCKGKLSVWGAATRLFDGKKDASCLILSLTVSVKAGGVELALRENAYVSFATSPRLQELDVYFASNKDKGPDMQQVTASFVHKPLDCEGEVYLVNCCVLASTRDDKDNLADMPFQAMSVNFEATSDQITTKDGTRLFLPARMYDWSGNVMVAMVEAAVIQYFGKEKDAVQAEFGQGDLQPAAPEVCRHSSKPQVHQSTALLQDALRHSRVRIADRHQRRPCRL